MNKRIQRKKSQLFCMKTTVALTLALLLMLTGCGSKEPKEAVITQSVLENVVNVSELSTFEATYNGVAQVMNEKKTDKVDFYVSYEAKVKVGFDFSKISFVLDDDAKTIVVNIPKVSITDTTVDITSLDYIFVNDKANNETVSQIAYKACEDDVAAESAEQKAIFELAQQNAENIVRALVVPFVEQLDAEYTIEFRQEG